MKSAPAIEPTENPPQQERLLLSGNEAVARAVWEAGATVATAYPGTPSTEILEAMTDFEGLHANWSPNEKVALEVAIGASMVGARAFCAMKHVGMNVASDALMTQTLAGVEGGLVVAVADDVGMSSSQNEQDSRYWGRFAHLPILEPADSEEAYRMAKRAFEISEQFGCPVILRLTTRICHVKTLTAVGERVEKVAGGFSVDPSRWVMVPGNAKKRLVQQHARDIEIAEFSETCDLHLVESGADSKVGFVTSGPAYLSVREAFPEAPVFKLGLSFPLPRERLKAFANQVEHLVVVEETEPLVETELRAAGIEVHGKDLLPAMHEIMPSDLTHGVAQLLGVEKQSIAPASLAVEVFPRPPTMCIGCPHLGVYYTLSRFRKQAIFAGDIGCYTLGAGHPWNALDTCICMGSAIGLSLGMDLARGPVDKDKAIFAVMGDSTFLHMGIQGLLDLVYNGGNVTVMLLDNSATGMTGGQDNHASGRDLKGQSAPKVDFARLVGALGVEKERVRVVDPYVLPELYKTIKEEIKRPQPSVIITKRPCVLIDQFKPTSPLKVEEDSCTGCAVCLKVGCPAIQVTHRETETRQSGREIQKAWVRIESAACTGCDICPSTCGPGAIVPV